MTGKNGSILRAAVNNINSRAEALSFACFLAAVCWITYACGRLTFTVTAAKLFPGSLFLVPAFFFLFVSRRKTGITVSGRDLLLILLPGLFLFSPYLGVITGGGGYDYLFQLCLRLFYLALVIYIYLLLNSLKRLQFFALLFPGLLLLASIAGILEYLGLAFIVDNWEHNTVAVFFKNPNIYSAFLLACLPVTYSCLINQKSRACRVFLITAGVLGLFNLFLTGSRSAFIAHGIVLAAAVILFIRRGKKQKLPVKWLIILLIIVLALFLLFFILNYQFIIKILKTFNFREPRMLFYRTAFRIWTAGPLPVIAGNGPGAFYNLYHTFRPADYRLTGSDWGSEHAHNLILEILCEGGIIGLMLFLVVLVLLFNSVSRLIRQNRLPAGVRTILAGYSLALLALLIDGLFSTNVQEPATAAFFYLLLGVLICFSRFHHPAVSRRAGRKIILPAAATGITVLVILLAVVTGFGRRFASEYQLLRGLETDDPAGQENHFTRAAALAGGSIHPVYHLARYYLEQDDYPAFLEKMDAVENIIENFSESSYLRSLGLLFQKRYYEGERLLQNHLNQVDKYDRDAGALLVYLSLLLKKNNTGYLRDLMQMDFLLNRELDIQFVYEESVPAVRLGPGKERTILKLGKKSLEEILKIIILQSHSYNSFLFHLHFYFGELYLQTEIKQLAVRHFMAAYDTIARIQTDPDTDDIKRRFAYTTTVLKQLLEETIAASDQEKNYLQQISLLKQYLKRFPSEGQRNEQLLSVYQNLLMFKAKKVWSIRFKQALEKIY